MSAPENSSNQLSNTEWIEGVIGVAAGVISFLVALQGVNVRNDETRSRANNLDLKKTSYQFFIRVPHSLYFYTVLFTSILLIAIAGVQFLIAFTGVQLGGEQNILIQFFARLRGLLWPAIGASILTVVFFYSQFLERFFLFAFSFLGKGRRGFGWINAKWELESKDYRRVLIPSRNNVGAMADDLVEALVGSERNPDMALRPGDLSDEVASNILYFGHVVEDYYSSVGKEALPWTDFYKALATVSAGHDAPFSVGVLKDADTDVHQTLMRANSHLTGSQIENLPGLEEKVQAATQHLAKKYKGDARRIAKGLFGSSYENAYKRSEKFLAEVGVQRQFAKLFVLWKLVPKIARPDAFAIPFSPNILRMYLDRGVLNSDGPSFRINDERVTLAMELAQKEVMTTAAKRLEASNDPDRRAWRNDEKSYARSHELDWQWWLLYRIDQQLYAMRRAHPQGDWRVDGQQLLR